MRLASGSRRAGVSVVRAGEASLPGERARDPQEDRREQLEYLMRRYGDQILRLAHSYLGDRDLAEDVAQEVFVRAYQSLGHFRGDSSYYTWLYRITVNLCRDHLRARRCQPVLEPLERVEGVVGEGPEETALEVLGQEELWRALLELPVAYREVLLLHYYHELPVKEVARVLGLAVPAVKVRLFRARQKLAARLGEGV